MAANQRAAMRLLPGGPDHVCRRAAASEAEPKRCRHRCRHVRKYLPMRYLPAHSHGHQTGCQSWGANEMSAVADEFAASRTLTRRQFLLRLEALGGLLLVADGLHIAKAADAAPKYGADGMPHGTVDNPLVFLTVGDDGWVTIVVHRSEMGQGVRTGMPLIVADGPETGRAPCRPQPAPSE